MIGGTPTELAVGYGERERASRPATLLEGYGRQYRMWTEAVNQQEVGR